MESPSRDELKRPKAERVSSFINFLDESTSLLQTEAEKYQLLKNFAAFLPHSVVTKIIKDGRTFKPIKDYFQGGLLQIQISGLVGLNKPERQVSTVDEFHGEDGERSTLHNRLSQFYCNIISTAARYLGDTMHFSG